MSFKRKKCENTFLSPAFTVRSDVIYTCNKAPSSYNNAPSSNNRAPSSYNKSPYSHKKASSSCNNAPSLDEKTIV